jgi:hypothetical protein
MENENTSITFRLPPELHEQVVQQAKLAGVSKHAFARTLVVRAMDTGEQRDMAAAIGAFEDAMNALRQAVARGVGAILQNVSDLSEQEIRDWIFNRMLNENTPPMDGKSRPA